MPPGMSALVQRSMYSVHWPNIDSPQRADFGALNHWPPRLNTKETLKLASIIANQNVDDILCLLLTFHVQHFTIVLDVAGSLQQ